MQRVRVLAAWASVAFAPAALAQVWDETANGGGDAGDLLATAQVCAGSGTLAAITGNNAAADVDMFKIQICDSANFTASTVGAVTWDTQLFLFDSEGMGVTHDDDNPGGGLQSIITGVFVPGPGVYYLAISKYNRDPVDAAGALIWANTPFGVERQPDGPGAANPVAGWSGAPTASNAYTINLTGVCYVSACGWTPPCFADYDGDGFITGDDATLYVIDFEGGNLCADVDGDGFLTGDDYTLWVTQFENGC